MIHLLLAIIYIAFISLGLPDGLLGAGWPVMHQQFGVPVSYMGPVSLLIALGTVVSSLFTARLVSRFGTGKITAFSVATTAVALLGFACSREYWMLYLWVLPYGLGAGCVDACLNNYVATHYESRHMSWLHCMWGLGASTGPYVMGFVLTGGLRWNMGYALVGVLQILLSAILIISLPLWKRSGGDGVAQQTKVLNIPQVIRLPGVVLVMAQFFCYCAAEQTAGQWASSYMALHVGMSEEIAASLGSLYYIGITVGRFLSGFLTMRLSDKRLISIGAILSVAGAAMMLLPVGPYGAAIGILLAGLGSAPVYPCIVHSIPALFGADSSQAILGVVVASAYMGTCLMPAVFGVMAEFFGMWLLPIVLMGIFGTMFLVHKHLYRLKKL